MTVTLLSARDIVVRFPGASKGIFGRRDDVDALKAVSVEVHAGETVGLVGESGSGKSTLAKAILGIVPIVEGTVEWNGQPAPRQMTRAKAVASRHAQLVFQDPYSSLNPMMTVRDTLVEVLSKRGGMSRESARRRAGELLDAVQLPESALNRFPSEFSGGQRQRIVIARALAAEPELLVCDEPLSALDVTTQGKMIELLIQLQADFGMAMLFIGHDLSVVRHLSNRMIVMFHGEIVEEGLADEVYERPRNAYTQRLVSSIPVADPTVQRSKREMRMAIKVKNEAAR